MMMSQVLGRGAEVFQIVEFDGPTHDAQWMLPDAEPRLLKANAAWLKNHFWAPQTNRLVFSYQFWLVKLSDAIVLVDTGCGNAKARVSPYQNMINTPVLDWLAAAGAPPEKVTHVLHTHLHCDHVGWNTRLLDGRWVPTFPNATYYMPKLDYEMFVRHEAQKMSPDMYDEVIADSVTPIVDEGLSCFVSPGDEIAGFVAHAAPGHTPGQMIYSLTVNGEELIFSGDVFHSPIQVLHPHINSRWCEDDVVARETRGRLLEHAARANARILPAHIQGVGGWRIGRGPNGFSVDFDHTPGCACGAAASHSEHRR